MGIALGDSVRRFLCPRNEVGHNQWEPCRKCRQGPQLQVIQRQVGCQAGHQCKRFAAGQSRQVDPLEFTVAPAGRDLAERSAAVAASVNSAQSIAVDEVGDGHSRDVKGMVDDRFDLGWKQVSAADDAGTAVQP
ncbi:MAG: hypothetical protein ACTH7N_15750, partial [Brevibacterium aurantiacum]